MDFGCAEAEIKHLRSSGNASEGMTAAGKEQSEYLEMLTSCLRDFRGSMLATVRCAMR